MVGSAETLCYSWDIFGSEHEGVFVGFGQKLLPMPAAAQ